MDTPVPCGGDPEPLWILPPSGLAVPAPRARKEGSPQPRKSAWLQACEAVAPSRSLPEAETSSREVLIRDGRGRSLSQGR